MLYAMPIASANFTVQKQKLISPCRIQSEDLTQQDLVHMYSKSACGCPPAKHARTLSPGDGFLNPAWVISVA